MWPVPCHSFRDRTGWDSQYSKWGGGLHLVHLIVHLCILSIGPSIHPPVLLSQLSVSLSQSSVNFSCLSFRVSLSSLSLYAQALLAHISTSSTPCRMPRGSGHISRHPSPFSKGPGRPSRIAFLSRRCIYPDICCRPNAHTYPSLPCLAQLPYFAACTYSHDKGTQITHTAQAQELSNLRRLFAALALHVYGHTN